MLRVKEGATYGSHLITTDPIAAGAVVQRIDKPERLPRPTYRTIQVSEDTHVDGLGALAYLNHSCAPNTFVDTERLEVRALRDIQPGEELTFFYPSTEWEMDRPFACLCGAPDCIGLIAGAKALPPRVLERYALSDHVRRLLRRRGPAGAAE